ncbi:hypothetical protein HXX76_009883 [Chlamydomonas incerta]|uniref:Cyclic nucleotide-binding domain-containing protein n=1 Tax=Chlamydomonas incerta TaxID=51695 RepID=A0A835T3H3_CHLIN|nr:hypothetical protein HXX76_009883 [Chlamydomonas incerta]|eukprot:KAG2430911.1 hypothetical protein HXX76_009883 [Chlamydomonas incerta]
MAERASVLQAPSPAFITRSAAPRGRSGSSDDFRRRGWEAEGNLACLQAEPLTDSDGQSDEGPGSLGPPARYQHPGAESGLSDGQGGWEEEVQPQGVAAARHWPRAARFGQARRVRFHDPTLLQQPPDIHGATAAPGVVAESVGHQPSQPAMKRPRGSALRQRPLQPDYDRLLSRRAHRGGGGGSGGGGGAHGHGHGGDGGNGDGGTEDPWEWEWEVAWDPSWRPPWIIPARALGEKRELVDEDTDDDVESGTQDSENAEDVGDCFSGTGGWGRACCRRTIIVSWSHLVASCQAAIRKPSKSSELEGESAANTIAAVAVRPMGLGEGCLIIARVLLWDRISCFSRFRTAWDCIILVLLIYVAFVTPYVIGFAIEYTISSWQGISELTVNGFFMMDILLNMRTTLPLGYDAASRNQEIRDRWAIIKHYLLGWFVLDVLAALPWTQMTASLGGYMALAKVPRLIRLVRLAKLLRLLKLAKVLQTSSVYRKWETRGSVAVARVSLYVLAAILGLHLCACAWMFVAEMENSSLEGTWVEAAGLVDADNLVKYITSLYFVVITFTTVGYGDIAPVTTAERVLTCLGMMIGVVMLGYIVSTANTIMGTSNKYDVARNEVSQRVEDFLNSQPLPSALAAKVKAYYGYVAAKPFNDEGDRAFVAELPCDMRADVLREMHCGLISRVPLFKTLFPSKAPAAGAPAPYVHPGLVLELVAVLKLEFYTKGDCVVMEGGWDTEMYFVTEGVLSVRQYRADNVAALTMTHTLSREDFAEATHSLSHKAKHGAQAAAGTLWSGLQHAGAALFGGGGAGGAAAGAAGGAAGAAGGAGEGGEGEDDYGDTLSEGAIDDALDAGYMPWRNIPLGRLQAPSVRGPQIFDMYVRWMEHPPAGTWLEHWPKRHRPRTSSTGGGGGGAGADGADAADGGSGGGGSGGGGSGGGGSGGGGSGSGGGGSGGGGSRSGSTTGRSAAMHLKHFYSAPPEALSRASASEALRSGGSATSGPRAVPLPPRVTEEGDDVVDDDGDHDGVGGGGNGGDGDAAAARAAVEDAVAPAEAEAEAVEDGAAAAAASTAAAAATPFGGASAFAATAAQAAAGVGTESSPLARAASGGERPSRQFGPLDPLVQPEDLPPGVQRQPTAGLGVPGTPGGGRGAGGRGASSRRRRHWRMRYDDHVPYKHVRTIKRDGFFGEYGCLTGCPRTASVVAKGMAELYCLARADLAAAMGKWPGLAAAWQEVEAFGEAERHKLRAYLRGGHAPEAAAVVHDLSSALGAMSFAARGGSAANLNSLLRPAAVAGSPSGARDPRVMNSEMRYQAFLQRFHNFEAPAVAAAAAFGAAEAGGPAAVAAAANDAASVGVTSTTLTPMTSVGASGWGLSPAHLQPRPLHQGVAAPSPLAAADGGAPEGAGGGGGGGGGGGPGLSRRLGQSLGAREVSSMML